MSLRDELAVPSGRVDRGRAEEGQEVGQREPTRSELEASGRPIAAPAPPGRASADSRAHRIQYDISTRLEHVLVARDLAVVEAVAEEMPCPAVTVVPAPSVSTQKF